MEDQRHIADGVLDALDEVLCLVGAHGACHILQADGVKAHVLELFAHLDILFHGVDRALRVGDAAGSNGVLAAVFLGGFQCGFDVAEIVQRVKDTQNVDAVFDRQLDELFHNVVVIVLVAEQVLSAKEHLQLRVGHQSADIAQALPRIFAEIAKAGVKRCAAPAFNRIVTGLIHLGQNRLEIGIRQTGCHQGLIRITKDSFSDLNFFHVISSSIITPYRRLTTKSVCQRISSPGAENTLRQRRSVSGASSQV